MDEGSLEAAIEAYSAQLRQVETALGAEPDPTHQSDLLKLKEDLLQLIQLTESSLVSVKKSRLLASLEDMPVSDGLPVERPGGGGGGGLDQEFAAFYSELGQEGAPTRSPAHSLTSPGQNEDEEEENGDTLSGTKVRAPYRSAWGTLEYHNAMVVGAEPSDGSESCVRVLYIHPTHKSMKPCPFFLEDKCRFMENCRFSHGEVVGVSELRQFQDWDLSNLQEGSTCLARHEDGIWYPAKITDMEDGFYTVKFSSLLQRTAVVEADGVIPPLRQDDPSSSSSSGPDDDDEEFGERSVYAKVLDSTETGDWAPACSSGFAGWEAHTRAIGSKLMLKMGYEFGKGLGRSLEGRVEPVMAVILPKGRSLDQCAQIKEKAAQKRLKKGEGSKARRKGRRAGSAPAPGGRGNVFDFLNRKLGDRLAEADSQPAPRSSKDAYRGDESAKRALNVQLFQATERVAQTEREMQRLSQALARQAGRDRTMVAQLEEKMASTQAQLSQLKAQEQRLQQEQRKAHTHKNMTKF